MHEKLNRGLTFSLLGNILFVLFGLVCFIFNKTYKVDSLLSNTLEGIAYTVEVAGFVFFIIGILLIIRTTRMRVLMKTALSVYTVTEAVMMILELNSFRLSWYVPSSLLLAIVHSIFSAAVCFSLLSLDPYKNKFEVVTIICIGVILGGMFGNLLGIRIYFSIIVNAVAFSVMFGFIKVYLKNEEIEIDCYGDRARVAEYKSEFFEE